jgi:hypothetical protein
VRGRQAAKPAAGARGSPIDPLPPRGSNPASLDAWLSSLASPAVLAVTQGSDSDYFAHTATLRSRLTELDKQVASLVHAIEDGEPPKDLVSALTVRSAERDQVAARLKASADSGPKVLTATQIAEMLDRLGGLMSVLPTADPLKRAVLYQALNLRLYYFADRHLVRATADLGVSLKGVRGGT